jgi:hypothetical protein
MKLLISIKTIFWLSFQMFVFKIGFYFERKKKLKDHTKLK